MERRSCYLMRGVVKNGSCENEHKHHRAHFSSWKSQQVLLFFPSFLRTHTHTQNSLKTRFMFHQRWVHCGVADNPINTEWNDNGWGETSRARGCLLRNGKVHFQLKRTVAVWKRLNWQLHEWCERHCASTDNPSDSIKTPALQKNAQTEEIITQPHTHTHFLNSNNLLIVCVFLKFQCLRFTGI